MSLNGLDSPAVQDAYQTAQTEPGGWLLLKYASRDQVELLDRGSNGVTEARNAIHAYAEPSPLYGLIIYRRRRVLIKYIPDATSRVLKARTAVHFNDIVERYSPYETLLEISTAEGLNDTSLAASFPLHTASPAASSSRLGEISEVGEDASGSPRRPPRSKHSSSFARYGSQRSMIDRMEPPAKTELVETTTSTTPSIQISSDSAPSSPQRTTPTKPSLSQYLVRDESGKTSITPIESPISLPSVTEYTPSDTSMRSDGPGVRALDPSVILDRLPEASRESPDAVPGIPIPPKSSARASQRERLSLLQPKERPSPSKPLAEAEKENTPSDARKYDDEPYDFSKFDALFKPKVKLGPRPVATADKTRQRMTASVAGVPAGFRSQARKQEPQTQRPPSNATLSVLTSMPKVAIVAPPELRPAPPPIPDTPEYNPRPVSRGSIKSLPSHKSTSMTSDKLRLMKAVEFRKKQLRKSNPHEHFVPPKDEDAPDVPAVPAVPLRAPERGVKEALHPESAAIRADHLQTVKADSGIGMPGEKPEVDVPKPAKSDEETKEQRPVPEEPPDLVRVVPDRQEPQEELRSSASTPVEAQRRLSEETDNAAEPPIVAISRRPEIEDSSSSDEELAIPTIILADGSRPLSTGDHQPHFDTDSTTVLIDDMTSSDEDADAGMPGSVLSPKRPAADLAKRRRGFVEPLHVEINSGNPDDFNSDDEFLEELHSATLQEARQTAVTVAKSPASAFFPGRRPSGHSGISESKSTETLNPIASSSSMPIDKFYEDRMPDELSPPEPWTVQVPSRTPSPAVTDTTESAADMARSIASGVSKGILAIANGATGESVPATYIPTRPRTPTTPPDAALQQDINDRRNSLKSTQQRMRPTSFRKRSNNRLSGLQSSGYISPIDTNATWNVQHEPAAARNSVSVTARIVRPTAISEEEQSGGDQFQRSELTVNHQRGPTPTGYPSPQRAETGHVAADPTSPALSRGSIDVRPMHSASRFGRHKPPPPPPQHPISPPADDYAQPPSYRTNSRTSQRSDDDSPAVKEGSRTSRFFKRMSNLSGAVTSKRRSNTQSSISSLTSPKSVAPSEGSLPPVNRGSVPDTPPAVLVGDLNVQFPDSLLWKRRIVTIDDAGCLTFAIAQALDIHKAVAIRRYPLSDFKLPYAPDPNAQEMPHSVVMEFHGGGDGTVLQAACEDAMMQRQVLHLLRMYWKAYVVPAS